MWFQVLPNRDLPGDVMQVCVRVCSIQHRSLCAKKTGQTCAFFGPANKNVLKVSLYWLMCSFTVQRVRSGPARLPWMLDATDRGRHDPQVL